MYIIAAVAGYIIGTIAKLIVSYTKDKKESKKRGFRRTLLETGGMPSGHSATVTALTTYILLADGIWSASFGISATFAIIVMIDAINVRRATGENGTAIQKILSKSQHNNIDIPHFAKGHKPLEMLIGATIGVIIGVIVFFLAHLCSINFTT